MIGKAGSTKPKIATFITKHSIPVLLDRARSPVLDGALFDFVNRTRGAAGWPLNVFLTPAGAPLVGTVYLPPAQFMTWLQRLQGRWDKAASELEQVARRANRAAAAPGARASLPAEKLAPRLRQALLTTALGRADELAGGFDEQAKFPSAPQLDALLGLYETQHDRRLGAFLRLTLDQMAGEGLRDHLGGGFFRYTADPAWQEPCFEKMLFVNAQLASLYLKAARVFDEARYRRVGLETVDFLLRELSHPDGGFIAGLAGGGGGYYLWDQNTLQSLLDEKSYQLADAVWGLGGEPSSWSAGHLPVPQVPIAVVAGVLGTDVVAAQTELEGMRQRLLAARTKRDLTRDKLRIAGWNGLALSALAAAVEVSPKPRYRQAGEHLRDYLTGVLWHEGSLARVRDGQGRVVAEGTLEDYAYTARGLADWAVASGVGDGAAATIVAAALRRFHTAGGWQPAGDTGLIVPAHALLPDGATPSASAVLAAVSLRVTRADGQEAPPEPPVPSTVLDQPLRFASYLSVLDEAAQSTPVSGPRKPRP